MRQTPSLPEPADQAAGATNRQSATQSAICRALARLSESEHQALALEECDGSWYLTGRVTSKLHLQHALCAFVQSLGDSAVYIDVIVDPIDPDAAA